MMMCNTLYKPSKLMHVDSVTNKGWYDNSDTFGRPRITVMGIESVCFVILDRGR